MLNFKKAKISFKTFFKKQLFSKSVNSNNVDNLFIENNFLINHKYYYIYCPIPKVACSSFKKLTILLSDLDNKSEILDKLHSRDFHTYIHNNFSLSHYNKETRQELLSNPSYFKFVIVRNPWSRLYSAYIDKFVRPKNLEDFAIDVIAAVYKQKSTQSNFVKSINFREFIEYICQIKEDRLLNIHWRPQYSFLGNIKFDFIGKFETLDKDFIYLKNKLKIDFNLPIINKIERDDKNIEYNLQNYSELYPIEFKKTNRYPKYILFYTPKLIEMVRTRYIKDIECFKYEFNY